MLLFCSDNHGLKHEIKSLSHWNYKHTEVRAYYPALTWNVNQLMPCDLYPEFSVSSTAGQGPCIKNDQAGEWMESLRNKPKIKIYKGKGGWQKPAACSRNVECTASLIYFSLTQTADNPHVQMLWKQGCVVVDQGLNSLLLFLHSVWLLAQSCINTHHIT